MADTEALFQRKFKRIAAPSSKGSEFSLVGYNILCDAVFHNGSAKYPYITDEALKCRGPDPSIAPRHTQLIKEVIYKSESQTLTDSPAIDKYCLYKLY
jgi:hypothetical protein